MTTKKTWRGLMILAAPLLGAVLAAGMASPAQAAYDGGCTPNYSDRVDGCGTYYADDFKDNPNLKWGHKSDAVTLWQSILFAEGFFDPGVRVVDGVKFTMKGFAEIDGDFGEKTYRATRAYQARHGAGIDGQVGPETWGKAGALLRHNPKELGGMIYYAHSVQWPIGRVFLSRGRVDSGSDDTPLNGQYSLLHVDRQGQTPGHFTAWGGGYQSYHQPIRTTVRTYSKFQAPW